MISYFLNVCICKYNYTRNGNQTPLYTVRASVVVVVADRYICMHGVQCTWNCWLRERLVILIIMISCNICTLLSYMADVYIFLVSCIQSNAMTKWYSVCARTPMSKCTSVVNNRNIDWYWWYIYTRTHSHTLANKHILFHHISTANDYITTIWSRGMMCEYVY